MMTGFVPGKTDTDKWFYESDSICIGVIYKNDRSNPNKRNM